MRTARTIVITALVVAVAAAPAVGTPPRGFVEPTTVVYEISDPTPREDGLFGWEVETLRDVDGDGVSELLIGEPDTETGSAYVYSGADGTLLYHLSGDESDLHGYSVADVGDVDGDGVADFVAGGIRHDSGRGVVRVYSGVDGELIRAIPGAEAPGLFGYDAVGLGDVDGDLVPDFAASAILAGGTGRVFVYSGATLSPVHVLAGDGPGDLFGSAVGVVDDIDKDGVDDLVVGARNAGAGGAGEVYVYSAAAGTRLLTVPAPPTGRDFGWFFATGVGDVDADGVADVYVGDFTDTTHGVSTGRGTVFSGRDGSYLLTFSGSKHHEGLGPGRGAGDVNGDGVPDVVAGSFQSSDGASEAGQLEIYSGVDGSLLRRITSLTSDEQLGFDALGFEDITGDGVPELIGAAANGDTVYLIDGVHR